jgi:hypothetical protein
MQDRMRDRDVIIRIQDDYLGLSSFFVLLLVAAIIGLFIWQPWNGTGANGFMTVTTQTERTTSK